MVSGAWEEFSGITLLDLQMVVSRFQLRPLYSTVVRASGRELFEEQVVRCDVISLLSLFLKVASPHHAKKIKP